MKIIIDTSIVFLLSKLRIDTVFVFKGITFSSDDREKLFLRLCTAYYKHSVI
jgi:hypothetical protein